MLFPLSKSFSSSRIFQKGGDHWPQQAHRTWSIDQTGHRERTLEIHQILVDKKPYSAQVQLAQKRADAARKRDAVAAQAYSDHIKEVQENIHQGAEQERRKMHQHMKEYKMQRSASDSSLAGKLKEQHTEFNNFKADMEERVKTMPALALHGTGAPPPKEHPDRTRQRSESRKVVMDHSKEYFRIQDEIQANLKQRPSTCPIRHGPSSDEVVEQKKAGALRDLSNQFIEYEAQLEGVYDRHHQRIHANLRAGEAWHTEHLEKKATQKAAVTAKLAATLQHSREEAAEMEEHMKTRPKMYGGYKPLVKSERRMRQELVDRDLHSSSASATFGTRSSATSVQDQRTLDLREH